MTRAQAVRTQTGPARTQAGSARMQVRGAKAPQTGPARVQEKVPRGQGKDGQDAGVPASRVAPPAGEQKPEPAILFQTFFKSVGTRTYAAQVKEAANGNHFLVLTDGRRDPATGEVRKSRVMVFSEDFTAFFRMLQETAQFIRANPVPEEVRRRREKFWTKKGQGPANGHALGRGGK